MRRSLFPIALAIVLLAVTATGSAKSTPEYPAGCTHLSTSAEFGPFSEKVWDLDRWHRGEPSKPTLEAMEKRRHCAKSPGDRRRMTSTWLEAKAAYYHHRSSERAEARKERREAKYRKAISPPGMETLEAIASCESGGDPGAVSADGSYRGKYQFDYRTWESVGGSGDPAAAPEKEQDERAAELYRRVGTSPWPICG